MAKITVSLIGDLYDCVKPLFDGTLQPEGVELAVTRSPSPEAMRRQLTRWEFDVCEMAFGAYLIARAQGADVTAIPVYPRRAFFHTNFICRAGAGIRSPHALANKRIGVPEYIQSATLWARGALEHDFGLDARNAEWFVERAGSNSTGEVLDFKPPQELSVRQTPGGKSLAAMLEADELDLALMFSGAASQDPARLTPLFADPIAEGRRFYAAHGFVPANHIYMVSGSLARAHPSVVTALYRAFEESKRVAREALPPGASTGSLFGNEPLARWSRSVTEDPFAYGVAPNRAMLRDVVRLCREHGLIRDELAPEDLFHPAVR